MAPTRPRTIFLFAACASLALQPGAASPLYTVLSDLKCADAPSRADAAYDVKAHALRVQQSAAPADVMASASWDDEIESTGWATLRVTTSTTSRASKDVKSYAAGALEGLLSAARISQHMSNVLQLERRDGAAIKGYANVRQLVSDSYAFARQNANLVTGGASIPPPDPYWQQVRFLLLQLQGIVDGYNVCALERGRLALRMEDILMANMGAGDLAVLIEAYSPAMKEARVGAMKEPQQSFLQRGPPAAADRDWLSRMARHGHCSALVRLTSDDILVGHTTFSDYSSMLRVFKYYDFDFGSPLDTPSSFQSAKVVAMSSYPGAISSTDDYYQLSSGLVVVSTAIEVLNPQLMRRIAEFPASSPVLPFLHLMAVNRMASSSVDWVALIAEQNFGLRAVEYTVVDYNQFVPNELVKDALVMVVDQVPGLSRSMDASAVLRNDGYVASVDRPRFDEVRDVTGHTAAQAKYGDLFSATRNPRAMILRQSAPGVATLAALRAVMRRNRFPDEGILPNDPGHAVSARFDLENWNHLPSGGIDAKVTNRCLLRSMQTQAASGPTHDTQPVFEWADANGKEVFPGWPHLGQPNKWGFGWRQMSHVRTTDLADPQGC